MAVQNVWRVNFAQSRCCFVLIFREQWNYWISNKPKFKLKRVSQTTEASKQVLVINLVAIHPIVGKFLLRNTMVNSQTSAGLCYSRKSCKTFNKDQLHQLILALPCLQIGERLKIKALYSIIVVDHYRYWPVWIIKVLLSTKIWQSQVPIHMNWPLSCCRWFWDFSPGVFIVNTFMGCLNLIAV